MAFRWRKSFTLFPGVRLNLGKSGVSASLGPRGASVNLGKKGVYVNTGLPGTGISQRTELASGPKTIAGFRLSTLVWANIVGWGGLFLFGMLIHWMTAGSRKWKHPVMVQGLRVNVHSEADSKTKVLAQVSTGDTLELQELSTFEHTGWAIVTPRADRGDFSTIEESGYIQSRFLLIPDSTIKRAAKGARLY